MNRAKRRVKVDYDILERAIRSGKYKTVASIAREYGVSERTVGKVMRKRSIQLPYFDKNLERDLQAAEKYEQWFSREWRKATERILGKGKDEKGRGETARTVEKMVAQDE